MKAVSERDEDFHNVYRHERLAVLRKLSNQPFQSLEEIMAKYRSVTRDKVLERAAASKNRSMGSTTIRLPDDFKNMPFFKVEKEVYNLDVIGYVVTDPKHPEGIEPGYIWHSRKYFSHRNIGAEENSYVCLARTFGKRCPICEFAKQGKNTGALDKDTLDALRPRERMLLCVIDHDDKEEKIQLWDVSYHLFGKMLDKELPDADDPEAAKFYEPDSGYTLRCRFSKETFNKGDFWKCDRIDFKTRKQNYPDSIVEEVPPLDDILIELSYDQLEEIFVMGDTSGKDDDEPRTRRRSIDADDDEETKPRRGRQHNEPEDDDEEEEERPERSRNRRVKEAEDDEDEKKVARPSRRGKTPDPEEEEPEDEEEVEEKPKRARKQEAPARSKRRKQAEPEPEDEPEEDDEEPEDEEEDVPSSRRPSRGSSKSDKGGKCPEGLVFGKDCETDDACDSCKIWGPCNAAKRKSGK